MLRKYDRAIEEQDSELARARGMARRSRCIGLFALPGASTSDRCDVLDNSIERMEANMSMLRRRYDQLSQTADVPDRQRILAAIDAHGCRDQQTAERRLPDPIDQESDSRALFDQVNRGVIIRRSSPSADDAEAPVGTIEDGNAAPGSYRTMCVRTCDGFYFPISFATSPANFGNDEQACQAQCPGTDVELYYHHVPDQESEDMVSLAGVPYTDLPTAFLYRKASAPKPPACGCHGAGKYSSIVSFAPSGKADGQPTPKLTVPSIALPPADPAASKKIGESAEAQATEPTPAADRTRRVRVVGPKFLPDPSKALDLQAQDRKKDP